jgi:hypothetical protein
LANQIVDLGNNRHEVQGDMMALFKAYNKQKKDFYDAYTYVSGEVKCHFDPFNVFRSIEKFYKTCNY